MKLKHINGGEETVIMEAPHEDALKAKASKMEGYPEHATWRRGPRDGTPNAEPSDALRSEPSEIDLEDGSVLRITVD